MPRYRGTPEGSVRSAVQDYLTARRVWWMRCQTGAHVVQPEEGKRRFVAFGRKGMADLLALRHIHIPATGSSFCSSTLHKVVWIETKGTKGQTREQKDFQKEVEEQGHTYILARCVEDLIVAGL